jgi:hypothetical protein
MGMPCPWNMPAWDSMLGDCLGVLPQHNLSRAQLQSNKLGAASMHVRKNNSTMSVVLQYNYHNNMKLFFLRRKYWVGCPRCTRLRRSMHGTSDSAVHRGSQVISPMVAMQSSFSVIRILCLKTRSRPMKILYSVKLAACAVASSALISACVRGEGGESSGHGGTKVPRPHSRDGCHLMRAHPIRRRYSTPPVLDSHTPNWIMT